MRILLILAVIASLLACGGGMHSDEANAPTGPPNILLIVADDLGYGDLGSYGQRAIRTPNLDRLANQGLRFTNFYAGSTVCAPSRASLMTGQHTGHTAIRGNISTPPMGNMPLPDAAFTVAEMLQGAGYRTGLIGKWGLGGPGSEGEPNRQGFDYFYGYLDQSHAHNYYPEFLFRNTERIPLDNVVPEPKRTSGAGYSTTRREYSHDLIADEALQFIERETGQPFFLALTLTVPHANNEGRELGMEVPDLSIYADYPWPRPVKGHAAMITRMDADIGRIMQQLDELGIADNTVVLFTSDNGPHREGGYAPELNDSNGRLRGIKRDLYEGGIRVPLIVRWPGNAPPAVDTNHVGAFWDLFPTFAEIAGVELTQRIDGRSLYSSFVGRSARGQNRTLYWEFHEGNASKQAIRMGKWKGVRLSPSSPIELYDLEEDLGETTDVARSRPGVVNQIRELMDTSRTESEIWPLRDEE